MDSIKWNVVADILESAFYQHLKCDIKRTIKTKDSIGGDIETVQTVYTDVPCYESQHPRINKPLSQFDEGLFNDGTYRVHFHPRVDIREGDIVVVKDRQVRTMLVGDIAYYPSHTRVELRKWDPMMDG